MESTKSWSSPKVLLTLIAMLLLASVVIVSILRDKIVNEQQWQVSVIGQGKVSYQPDTAIVQLGVLVDRAETSEIAISNLNEKMEAVIAAIQELGIDEKDIQTQGYSVYTQYDYIENRSILAGYNANQQVTIKVRELAPEDEIISSLITSATKAGANQVNGITFETANIEELKQEARLKAIADARNKAHDIASATDVKLGKIVGWWENLLQPPYPGTPYYFEGKGGGGVGDSIPSGINEVIIEINLNYQVK